MKIIKESKAQVNTETLSEEVIMHQIQQLELVYIQTISWILGYPMVVAKNNTKEEDNKEMYDMEQKNLKDLEKELEKWNRT